MQSSYSWYGLFLAAAISCSSCTPQEPPHQVSPEKFRQEIESIIHPGVLTYRTKRGDTVSELAIALTRTAREHYGASAKAITQEELLRLAGVTDPRRFPYDLELKIAVEVAPKFEDIWISAVKAGWEPEPILIL